MIQRWAGCRRGSRWAGRRLLTVAPKRKSVQGESNETTMKKMKGNKTLRDFLAEANGSHIKTIPKPTARAEPVGSSSPQESLSVFIETYGCQMNVSDSEIVRGVLLKAGHSISQDLETADVVVANTCAIRENAEAKVWHRLNYFKSLKSKNRVGPNKKPGYPIVGVLGCMAERLKTTLLEEDSVDFVCGPDAYRDVPALMNIATSTDQKAANVQLSLEETYADIAPVREVSSTSAFVSIMRGCNNMCTYCIVPFTRGRERSRDIESILKEISDLSEQGVKEVVLLGQNVNSYHDVSPKAKEMFPEGRYKSSQGFSNLYKRKDGAGARFADLLEAVANVNPEIRVRFTSPHPKDFPDEVLDLIAEKPNICKNIHMPAQSGSTSVLKTMRRGYSREAYDALIFRVRDRIPDITISSDFISGFCSESLSDHLQTIDLLKSVKFEQAFMFAYSMRDRTHAQYKLTDDVHEEEKLRRLQEVISTFRAEMLVKNELEAGRLHLVLVEGSGRKSTPEKPTLTGRTDGNKRCVIDASQQLPIFLDEHEHQLAEVMSRDGHISSGDRSAFQSRMAAAGDYVLVKIDQSKGQTLYGHGVAITTLMGHHKASVLHSRGFMWENIDWVL